MSDKPASQHLFADALARVQGICAALAAEGQWPAGIDFSRVVVEPPRDASHGDMATNAAMVLAKDAKVKPRDLAEKIAEKLRADDLIAARRRDKNGPPVKHDENGRGDLNDFVAEAGIGHEVGAGEIVGEWQAKIVGEHRPVEPAVETARDHPILRRVADRRVSGQMRGRPGRARAPMGFAVAIFILVATCVTYQAVAALMLPHFAASGAGPSGNQPRLMALSFGGGVSGPISSDGGGSGTIGSCC